MSPVRGSTTPPVEMPTPATGRGERAQAALTAAITSASTAFPPRSGLVGTRSTDSTTGTPSPVKVTRPHAILVPPMSTATTVVGSMVSPLSAG